MNTRKDITIEKGWSAFVKDSECLGITEFKDGGKAHTLLEIITKPTQKELKAELKARNISLPS
jgi:hypothetical protein